ncbi:MAG TPA: 30S ribosomal protein S12 methylthiotransferase RimO, partial [Clostridia bacterium]|nr:30S ribosomal protein S12 methylthiotransferase RimO [Clostridia bacterium]
TKARRLRQFMEVQQGVSSSINQIRYLGRETDVIVDGASANEVRGRTLIDAPDVDNTVVLHVGRRAQPARGDICRARITSVGPYDLYGILL